MPWSMLVSTGLSALGGYSSGQVAAANQKIQQAQQFQTNSQRVEYELKSLEKQSILQGKQNEQTATADLNTLLNTNFMAGLINVQRGISRVENVKGKVDVGRQRALALGQSEASAAASGTIGASVDAVKSDVEEKTGRALGQIDKTWEVQEMNYSTQIRNLYTGYEQNQAIIDDTVPDLPKVPYPPKYQKGPSFGQALGGALIQTAGDYLGARMDLGLGKPSYKISPNVQSSLSTSVGTSALANPSFSARL